MKNRFRTVGGSTFIYIEHGGETFTAIIDTEDLDKITHSSWCLGTHRYAVNGKSKGMHQFLFDCPPGLVIDHINHNRLDNRKANLRALTRAQNLFHRPLTENVYFIPGRGKWRAQIGLQWKTVYLGYFESKEEALQVAKQARERVMQGLPIAGKHRVAKSGIPGVQWDDETQKWRAVFQRKNLGRFQTIEEATQAIRDYAKSQIAI